MALDERLVRKGKNEPIDGLVQQGKAHVELAKQFASELVLGGWTVDDTVALEASVVAVESGAGSKAGARTEASGASEAESAGIDDAKQFIRKLRNGLPRAIREAKIAGVSMSSFASGETLGRVTPRISAYLTTIRPSVEKLDEKLQRYFDGKKATEVLDAVKAKLDGADAKQEVAWSTLPAETLSVYESKGRLLEQVEDLNRAGKSAFDGQADKIALFNKDILMRARKERAKAKGEEPKGGGDGGGGTGTGTGTG